MLASGEEQFARVRHNPFGTLAVTGSRGRHALCLRPDSRYRDASLNHVWATADEVPGDRCMLLGVAQPKAGAAEVLAALRRLYPGKAAPTVEQTLVHNWAGMLKR